MEPDHQDCLRKFGIDRPREKPADFSAALAWLSEAWELADRYCPEDSEARRERHLQELLHLRRSLERAFEGRKNDG